MASFNDPKLSNHIADDVPAIRQLLRSVAALDPATGNTDIPNGAKRLVETVQGYEFQTYNGTSWVTLEKWNLDVQKVDGYSASTGTAASTIPVRDANGDLPGNVLGNAGSADEAKTLSETLPLAKGGTGATTAADARNALVVPPKSHASSGGDYGKGTGSMFGHVSPQDTADSTKTAAGGYALSPKGAADMRVALEALIADAQGAVTGLDTALRALVDQEVGKCLKLSGGTLAGNISFSQDGDTTLWKAKNTARFILRGGGSGFSDGASLYLHGKGYATDPGAVLMYAHDGSQNAWLKLTPAGKLFVKSDAVLTSAGGNVGKLLSTVEVAMTRNTEDSRLWLSGGTNYNGGALILYGSEHAEYPNESRLKAGNTQLRVLSDGSCLVGGKNIVRSVNGVTANAGGNAAVNFVPDYSTHTVLAKDTTHTMSNAGFLLVSVYRANTGKGYMTITINSKAMNIVANDYSPNSFLLPVKGADTVKWTGTDLTYNETDTESGTRVWYYPIRY